MGRVEDLMGTARHIAGVAVWRYPPSVIEDTESDAMWGLARADRSFNGDHAITFHAWAKQRIWNEVIDGWRHRYGREYTSARRMELRQQSIDKEFALDSYPGMTVSIKDRLADKAPDPADQVCDRDQIRELLSLLSPRDARIMWDHYALGIPLRILGDRNGITECRVSQICKAGRTRLADHARAAAAV